MRTLSTLCLMILAGGLMASANDLHVKMASAWPGDSTFQHSAADYSRWWQTFDDKLLDSLITIGEANNYDLAAAAKRIDIARTQLRVARGGYSPVIGVSAGYTRDRQSGRIEGSTGEASTLSYFNAGATMS